MTFTRMAIHLNAQKAAAALPDPRHQTPQSSREVGREGSSCPQACSWEEQQQHTWPGQKHHTQAGCIQQQLPVAHSQRAEQQHNPVAVLPCDCVDCTASWCLHCKVDKVLHCPTQAAAVVAAAELHGWWQCCRSELAAHSYQCPQQQQQCHPCLDLLL